MRTAPLVPLLLLTAGAVVTGLAARDALVAADALADARGQLELLAGAGDPELAELTPALEDAADELAVADARLSSRAVDVVSRVPLLGRSWRAEQAVLDLAVAVVDGARAAVTAAPGLRDDAGQVDVAALRRTGEQLRAPAARARTALERLEAMPTGFTPPPVGRGVGDARSALGPATASLQHLAAGSRVSASLLGADGPRSVLVAVGNNAELRGTVGFVSTFATGELRDGRLELGPFRDVADVREDPETARRVAAPADFVEDYGPYLADTTDWRMWTMTPDAPAAASVGAQVAELLVGVRPDVVLLLDVPAVVGLAEIAGRDVVLPDGTALRGDDALRALLVDAYATAGEAESQQQARRAALSASAGAAATQLLASDVDLGKAVRKLSELGSGRHLALWSAREQEQRILVDLGVAGAVAAPAASATDDLCLVTVNNLSANKLDYYVDRTVQHEAVVGEDQAEVVQTVRLVNRAPAGLVPYVLGTQTPGRSSLRVEFSVPPTAGISSFTVDGQTATGAARPSPERVRAVTFVDLGRGEEVEVRLEYTIPLRAGRYGLRVVPQALARDAELDIRVRAAAQDGRLRVPPGFAADPAGVHRTGPFRTTEVLDLGLESPQGLLDRLRQFWREPVTLA